MDLKHENSDLQKTIAKGVEQIVVDAIKASWKNPRQSAFMIRFASAAKKASKIRTELEEQGEHVPAFLIASVTSRCNLHCAGCYSRCIETTTDETPKGQLTGEEWQDIFLQAQDLGISFILLAGGEPLLRRDIIEAAAKTGSIMFPIFTNGTFMDEAYFSLFERCRNLLPVLSIEGGKEATDARRGPGIYQVITANMKKLKEKQIMFGASITVTTENLEEVMSDAYVEMLKNQGCKMILYIEFVPVTDEAKHLAPGDSERAYMENRMEQLRALYDRMVLLSFPGDELKMGGCMAAGREFFHINSHGGAEPCPFSPYSDCNIRGTSLREALNSPLFVKLRTHGLLLDQHEGGCVLYEKRDQVEALLKEE